jgi:hypothetical protein
MKTKCFFLITFLILSFSGYQAEAQATREITGIVTSFKRIPLNNVRIHALKSGNTQVTDSSGWFNINCSDKDNLIFSASGFTEKKIKISKKTIYQVDLNYIFSESSFEKAIQNKHIKPVVLEKLISENNKKKEKDYSKYTSIYELIDVEIYDVRVSGTSVYNNKIKSMNLNPQVLYVVDDKIVTDISYINPTYVKSIEFVDDVGATMYGVMGANGVLKITLK